MTAADTDANRDDENDDAVISTSILEESASALPNKTLRWHYRSKHESLIAFSNREIYQNHLITFPTPANKAANMGVEYVYVKDGYYEGGGKNCNIREAKMCVTLVEEHIRKFPSRSLGIIAFSEKQQNAIENAIIDFRERNPQYEWFFDESKEEAFFVKNLENVQGDERDTIIFSICYAKDISGKMHLRFGPLSTAGGERRLNVAVTRAKCNIKLVGSILPADLDLSKTKSEGVKMLRSYIEFAQKGTSVLRPIEQTDDLECDDGFCKAVVDFLEKNGYRTQSRIGCSDYKIDIAVEHPENRDIFLAGIECDGLSYHRAKTARDRDHLRKAILENMGWRLYRLWSTEWVRHPEKEGAALLQFLKEALEDHSRAASEMPMPISEKEPLVDFPDEIATEYEKSSVINENQTPYDFPYYQEAKQSDLKTNLNKTNHTAIRSNILKIVSAEQPIHMDLLCKHLAATFEGQKLTESVKQAVDSALKTSLNHTVGMDESRFLFLLPKQQIHARVLQKNMPPRQIEYIHPEEISEALLTILKHSFGITTDDLIGECARIFGFEKKWPKVKQKIQMILNDLTDAGLISVIDGKATLSESDQ
jgi:very-short-patch-repair endonuclease